MTATNVNANADDLARFIRTKVAAMLGVPAPSIDDDADLAGYGLDSAAVVELLAELEMLLQRQLDPRLPWDFPTIRKLTAELVRTTA